LIDDVLDLSKIEAGRIELRPSPLVLSAMPEELDRLFRSRAEGKGLRFSVETEGNLSRPVLVDGAKLRQVLVNLVGNAVKFTREGGVTLRVRLRPEAEGKVRFFAEVEDTGPGISEEEQARLFQYFEQARAGQEAGTGTGLGLKISRELVRLMDGDILVRSREGAGSTFGFDIPLEETSLADGLSRTERSSVRGIRPEGTPYRILVVDDMQMNRRLLFRMLEPLGFQIREAEDGEGAIRTFGEWKPDLILMDIKMPKMDGFEAIRRIRESEAKGVGRVSIVAVTASAFEEDRRRICEGGADDFLRKPFQGKDLMERVGLLLGILPGLPSSEKAPPKVSAEEAPPPEKSREMFPVPDGATEQALDSLSKELIRDLEQAVREGDYFLLLELTERVGTTDPSLAEKLRELVRKMDFRSLMDLLPGEVEA
jgi:CheY-like chemotaxis protein